MWSTTRLRYYRCFARRAIEDDARKGVDTCSERVLEAFGPPRPFDAVANHEDQRLAEVFNTDAAVEERKADLEEQQKRRTLGSHPFLLVLALALTGGIEMLSCIAVLKARGIENPERTVWGLALAGLLFTLTAALVKLSAPEEELPSATNEEVSQ